MKIHTDKLTRADLSDALTTTDLRAEGVWIEELSEHGSRTRARRFDVRLAAMPRAGRRRQRNTGQYGAEFPSYYGNGGPEHVAATWDEHGRWMAELFERDPDAVVSGSATYDGRDDFHAQTDNRYHPARARLEELRAEIRAERISYGEIAELQGLADHIEQGDVELLEWAGVPESDPRAQNVGGAA